MSDNTPESTGPDTVSESITEFVRDLFSTSGYMMTGMLCVTTYIDEEGSRCFAISVAPEQGPENTAGLADVLQHFAVETIRRAFPIGGPDE